MFSSAFWGQSFVSELKRISAHSEKKVQLRKSSLLVPGQIAPLANGEQADDNEAGDNQASDNQANGNEASDNQASNDQAVE